MDCDQVRWLLSYEPRGTIVPQGRAVRRHLEACPSCRAFWQALQAVDRALAARPLAEPGAPLTPSVTARAGRLPRQEVAPPFSRAFWLFSAALTLCALVGGAWLLRCWAGSTVLGVAGLPADPWLQPAWAASASEWLSLQSGQVAQVILPAMAGALVSLLGAAVGFRAAQR